MILFRALYDIAPAYSILKHKVPFHASNPFYTIVKTIILSEFHWRLNDGVQRPIVHPLIVLVFTNF